MLRSSLLPLFTWVAAVLAPACTAQSSTTPDLRVPELGYVGILLPEVTDVRLPDTVASQDTSGGCQQTPLALAGAPGGGFAVVWRDMRDGAAGLYFARLAPDGSAREPERSICQPHTARRTDAAIALAPDGAGTVTWTTVVGRASVPFVRCFDAQGVLQGSERIASPPVAPVPGDAVWLGRDDAEVSCRKPTVVRVGDGRSALAWTRAGRILWIEVPSDGEVTAAPAESDAAAPEAEDGIFLTSNQAGIMACLWGAKSGGAQVTLRAGPRAATKPIGAGVPQSIQADPAGGWWVLLKVDDRSVLRHLATSGAIDRPESSLPGANAKLQNLAVFENGVAVLQAIEAPSVPGSAASSPEGTILLTLCDKTGKPRDGGSFTVPSAAARGVSSAQLASNGRVLLVVWQDLRNGDPDVYGRAVDPALESAARLGPERRLNTDVASSTQIHGAVSSSGARGVVTWYDERSTPARAYMRRFSPTGFSGDELALPIAFGATPAPVLTGRSWRPASAVRADGAALVVWKQIEDRDKNRILGQIVGLDGRALSGLIEFDNGTQPVPDLAVDSPRGQLSDLNHGEPGIPGDPAVTALQGDHGWAVAWPRAGMKGVCCRRVLADGSWGGTLRLASALSAGEESDVDIATLDDGRLICAWTELTHGKEWCIRGRILDESCGSAGSLLLFAHTARPGDWDPSLAPADDGGFAMSWTSGSTSDPVRDAVVQLFDSNGGPRGTYCTVCYGANEQDFTDVVRLADHSFAVSWEDDISWVDQVFVRRLARDGKSLGTMLRINQTETKFLADRVAPRIAAIGDGLAAVFGDRRRSLGFDVGLKLLGPRWDAVAAPAPADESAEQH